MRCCSSRPGCPWAGSFISIRTHTCSWAFLFALPSRSGFEGGRSSSAGFACPPTAGFTDMPVPAFVDFGRPALRVVGLVAPARSSGFPYRFRHRRDAHRSAAGHPRARHRILIVLASHGKSRRPRDGSRAHGCHEKCVHWSSGDLRSRAPLPRGRGDGPILSAGAWHSSSSRFFCVEIRNQWVI